MKRAPRQGRENRHWVRPFRSQPVADYHPISPPQIGDLDTDLEEHLPKVGQREAQDVARTAMDRHDEGS